MTKHRNGTDVFDFAAPALMVVGILAIYLTLTYLPLNQWGITIPTAQLWLYLPWFIALAVGLCALKMLWGRN